MTALIVHVERIINLQMTRTASGENFLYSAVRNDHSPSRWGFINPNTLYIFCLLNFIIIIIVSANILKRSANCTENYLTTGTKSLQEQFKLRMFVNLFIEPPRPSWTVGALLCGHWQGKDDNGLYLNEFAEPFDGAPHPLEGSVGRCSSKRRL